MIKFHYSYIIMAIGFILTGYYLNLIVFTSLILIHELGHYTIAKILKFNVEKIIIYPYGGLTKINDLINKNINHELLISISGIILQIIFFLIIKELNNINIIRTYTYNLYQKYNYELIIFNLLPIYPLDGSKILSSLLNKILPYNNSNITIIIVSLISIFIILIKDIYSNNYSNIIIISILMEYIYKFYKQLKYIYNKFLLERYMFKIKYKNKKYLKEEEFLNNLFDLNNKIW